MNALAQRLDLPEENLLEDEQKELILKLLGSIEKFGLKETIDCLISAIELRQESLEDDSKEYKDLQLLAGIMTSVSTAADALNAAKVEFTPETHSYRLMLEQQKRRVILAEMVLNIAQVKVPR